MTSKLKEIEAFILIGGQSRRFGEPKCLAEHKGSKLIEIVYSNIVNTFNNVSLVGKENHFSQYNFIQDTHLVQCPMNGISTALAAAKSDWIFILACDMPLVDSNTINFLYDKFDISKKALIPKLDGKLQPLCGFYNRSILKHLNLAIKKKEYSLFKVLNNLDIAKIAIPSDLKLQFLNINYPKDIEKIK